MSEGLYKVVDAIAAIGAAAEVTATQLANAGGTNASVTSGPGELGSASGASGGTFGITGGVGGRGDLGSSTGLIAALRELGGRA